MKVNIYNLDGGCKVADLFKNVHPFHIKRCAVTIRKSIKSLTNIEYTRLSDGKGVEIKHLNEDVIKIYFLVDKTSGYVKVLDKKILIDSSKTCLELYDYLVLLYFKENMQYWLQQDSWRLKSFPEDFVDIDLRKVKSFEMLYLEFKALEFLTGV